MPDGAALGRPRTLDMVITCAEHIEQAGLTPILGHPERCALVIDEPGWVTRFRRRVADPGQCLQPFRPPRLESRDLGWSWSRMGGPILSARRPSRQPAPVP